MVAVLDREVAETTDADPNLGLKRFADSLEQAVEDALALPWGKEAKEALEAVLRELAWEGIQPGDRRQFKSVAACQAFAWVGGAERVEPEHLEVLAKTSDGFEIADADLHYTAPPSLRRRISST